MRAMSTVIETPSALIDALGGTAALAARLGVGRSAVSNWRREGIPRSRHYEMARIAEGSGLRVDDRSVFVPPASGRS